MKLKVDITQSIQNLLAQEDSLRDFKITKDDKGCKAFTIHDLETRQSFTFKGNYELSNLLQHLILIRNATQSNIGEIDVKEITQNPVVKIKKDIEKRYWKKLTRSIDAKGLAQILSDEKVENKPILYIHPDDKKGIAYFQSVDSIQFKIEKLPEQLNDETENQLKNSPGLLALALRTQKGMTAGVPFVVPGGRFNEMYGWDSYFIALGLLESGNIKMAKNIAENFRYQLKYYGKILNANRSYFLFRSQPPFYSSLIRAILDKKKQKTKWIAKHLKSLIHEYETVWQTEGKRRTKNGLNRYFSEGFGIPKETEIGHYDSILKLYAKDAGMNISEFIDTYNAKKIRIPELDTYFLNDKSMRESGLDTTTRFVNRCAQLNTIDLNSLLAKYELDIAYLIESYFDGNFEHHTSHTWDQKRKNRIRLIDEFIWDSRDGMYYDYDFENASSFKFESATVFYALWAKIASEQQANLLVKSFLPKISMKGGIVSCTLKSLEDFNALNDNRQWDYPYGWAPHQMMLWQGLINYGFLNEANEMIYRWLWLIIQNVMNYSGTIAEKYNLADSSCRANTEYGNVGTDFMYYAYEGFGWVNASYLVGLNLLPKLLKKQLKLGIDPDILFPQSAY